MLQEALTGWDALQGELMEAAGLHPHGRTSQQAVAEPADPADVSAAQAVVDAVCALHLAGVLRYPLEILQYCVLTIPGVWSPCLRYWQQRQV